MSNEMHMQVTKDLPNKKITVTRHFDAAPELVWRAWTESELLDQWWAPKPWRTETKTMDFREGGHWLYAMVGPDNEKHWVKVDFHTIDPYKSFTSTDYFCDEEGNLSTELPGMKWNNVFQAAEGGTQVLVVLTFHSEADMEKIIAMGFESGFTSALTNLDALIATQAQPQQAL